MGEGREEQKEEIKEEEEEGPRGCARRRHAKGGGGERGNTASRRHMARGQRLLLLWVGPAAVLPVRHHECWRDRRLAMRAAPLSPVATTCASSRTTRHLTTTARARACGNQRAPCSMMRCRCARKQSLPRLAS